MSNSAKNSAYGSAAGTAAGAAVGGPMGAMVGSSLGGMIGGMFGSDSSEEALDMLKKAQAAIQAIPEPTAKDLQLILSPLVSQGVLTPEVYSTILQQPSEFMKINLDQAPRNSEMAALSQLSDIANEGGYDAQARAAYQQALNQGQMHEQGSRNAILQNAAERGVGNSNLTAATQLAQGANDATNMNLATGNIASQAEQRALQALAESAAIGGNVASQDWQQASQKAAAMDAINRYNASTAQTQGNLNTATKNAAQEYNLNSAQTIAGTNNTLKNQMAQWNAQLPQQIFSNKLAKQEAVAGMATPAANLLQQGYQAGGQRTGGIISGLGQNLSDYATTKAMLAALSGGNKTATPQAPASSSGGWDGLMSKGGRVPGKPLFPGDNPGNDTVPARLSPGEVVLPRSASTNPAKAADFVKHLPYRDDSKIHPDDVKTVLQALTAHRVGMWRGGMAC